MHNVETPTWPYDPRNDFVDFTVVATNGRAGTVDVATYDRPAGEIVVRGGLRVLARRTLLPARVIADVDRTERKVYVTLTRAQICETPEFDAVGGREPQLRGGDGERST